MPRHMLNTFPRRRLVLICFGLLWVGTGMQLVYIPNQTVNVDLAIVHQLIPIWIRVLMWVVSGIACVLLSSTPELEKKGWWAAMIMPVERMVSYFISGLMWVIPGWPPGAVNSFGESIYWAIISVVIWLIAGMPEVQERT